MEKAITVAAPTLLTWLLANWKEGLNWFRRQFGRSWEEVNTEYKEFREKIMAMERDNSKRLILIQDLRAEMKGKYPEYANRWN